MAFFFKRAFSTFRAVRATINMDSPNLPDIFLPPVNRSMTELDRSFFRKVVGVSVVSLPKGLTNQVRATLLRSRELLQIAGIRPVVSDPTDPDLRGILTTPDVKADQPETWSPQLAELVKDNVARVQSHDLTLTYDDWSMQNILEAILPDSIDDQRETPGGFAMAGHVAHLNLREQYLPYKKLIGQILLDKNPTVRTVINKTMDVGSESVYRTFPYEILAGENDLEVTLIQQGCEFRFNYAEVYWNTRLATEHERLVAKFKVGEAVCDVTAGVGPFAVPAGKKGVWVRANDLNPRAIEALVWAVQRNKVQGLVSATCSDGREFIQNETKRLCNAPRSVIRKPDLKIPRDASPARQRALREQRQLAAVTLTEPRVFDHFVMNLPATCIEFLDAFRGLYIEREAEFAPHTSKKLPMVHVYTFQTKMETEADEIEQICRTASTHLGTELKPDDEDTEVAYIRLVSPQKRMYRLSFRLPPIVAFVNDSA